MITKEVLYTLKKLEPFFSLFRIGRLRMKRMHSLIGMELHRLVHLQGTPRVGVSPSTASDVPLSSRRCCCVYRTGREDHIRPLLLFSKYSQLSVQSSTTQPARCLPYVEKRIVDRNRREYELLCLLHMVHTDPSCSFHSINSYKPSPQFISFFLHNNIIRSIDQIIICMYQQRGVIGSSTNGKSVI